MKKHLIIVASGQGLRMGGDLPKQFMPIGGKPLLMHTIRRFYDAVPEAVCILVLPEEHISYWNTLCNEYAFNLPVVIVKGGATRFHSVKNGIEAITDSEGIVAVHDGVRPFPSARLIKECYMRAEEEGAVIPALPPTESIREVDSNGNRVVNRDRFRMVQTPQTFRLSLLKEAYRQPYNELFTDDASVAEASGKKITLIDGDRENIKITHQADLLWAEIYLTHS